MRGVANVCARLHSRKRVARYVRRFMTLKG